MSKKELREEQKFWLDQIHQKTGDNWAQMTEACNLIAEKTGVKPVGESTIRNFYNGGYGSGQEDRILNDKVVLLLSKAYKLEPTFSKELTYDMEKDDAPISQHAKFCKQYVTDVSLAKGIYRMDMARNVGLNRTRLSQLFGDHLPSGLTMEELNKIKEHYKINFSPRFREFLESDKKEEAAATLPVIGFVSLKSSDQIILYPETEQRKIPLQQGVNQTSGRVVELKGPTINPMIKDGMLYFYEEVANGVGNECIDETCVVETIDGQIAIKMVERTNAPDTYRLHSLIGAPLETAKLKRASLIRLILPNIQIAQRTGH